MLDNITALNVDEGLINDKIVKTIPGKYSKPAKLSSGKTFRVKTKEVMDKVNKQVNSTPDVAPTPTVSATPVAPTPELPAIELPSPEKVLDKAKIVNISAENVPNEGTKVNTPPRKLKVSRTVVTRTGNTLKVLESVPNEVVSQEVPAVPVTNEEVQVAPDVNVVPAPVEENKPLETDVNEQPNFFLGQKLNTEEIAEEDKVETPQVAPVEKESEKEVTETPEVKEEVTQEEKEDKLNQYLGRNQETNEEGELETLDLSDVLKDLDEYKTASEQIYSGQNEINKLNKDLAEAKRILAEKKKEAQQMIVNAKEVLKSQRDEITSKTQELSDVRDAIIRWTELKEKNQNRVMQDDENSYGKVA